MMLRDLQQERRSICENMNFIHCIMCIGTLVWDLSAIKLHLLYHNNLKLYD